MQVDLHVHTKFSRDSRSDPQKIIARAKMLGLGGIAITDHDTWDGAKHVRKLDREGLLIIPGAELKTDRGDVLALFVEEGFVARTFEEALDAIRARDGVCIVPHPASSPRMRDEDLLMADGVEVFNSTCSAASNARALGIAQRLHRPGFASSDAHMVFEVGNGATTVPDCESVDDLRSVILKNPVVSRAIPSNPLVHRANSLLMFGLKGLWMR